MTPFSDQKETFRVLLLDESADLKHVLMNAARLSESMENLDFNKIESNSVLLEMCLLENNLYIQSRNMLLMSILTTQDQEPASSRINAFVTILYNITIDGNSFNLMKTALKRYLTKKCVFSI